MPKKRKDGRYQSSVMLIDPLTGEKKRVYVYGYTEAELSRERDRIKRNNGIRIDDIFFRDWIDEWFKIKEPELSVSTIDDYTWRLKKHIYPYINNLRLKSITPSTIREILRRVAGDRSKKYIYMLLHAILQQAYVDEIIDRNPCIAVKSPKYKPKEKQLITNDLFKQLLDNASADQYRRIFILAYYTGMRRAEICALQWRNINLDEKIINITSAIKKTNAGNIIGKPKSDSSIKKILLSNNLKYTLQQQLTFQKERFLLNGNKIKDTDFVFTAERECTRMISPLNLTQIFNKTKKDAGIKAHVTFHSFRHTHTTMLVESGLPIKAIQSRLGHSAPLTTLTQYAHTTDKMQQDIVKFLNKMPKIV